MRSAGNWAQNGFQKRGLVVVAVLGLLLVGCNRSEAPPGDQTPTELATERATTAQIRGELHAAKDQIKSLEAALADKQVESESRGNRLWMLIAGGVLLFVAGVGLGSGARKSSKHRADPSEPEA